GDVATFSFFGNKTITTGEGGMLTSNNEALIKRAAYLKSQSVSASKEYWHDEIGFNFRMTNICAAIGVAQLENADEILQKKSLIAEWYQSELKETAVKFQVTEMGAINSYWMVTILAENVTVKDAIRGYLKFNGVETRPVFYPAHKMPAFQQDGYFPIAESVSERGINLPSFPGLSKDNVVHICGLIKSALDKSLS
ncbi:MAG: DegT/DnrJ/EryC1/StrS family aminotransferase, partial [Candidatus Thioglobus sp.]